MASIFAFRTRSPDRDRLNDGVRFEQLTRALDQLAAEIEAERTGIRNRYEAVSANAAFLVEAVSNDAVSTSHAADMDQLTEAIKSCLRRIEALGRQKEFVADLKNRVDDFAVEDRQVDTHAGALPLCGEASTGT